MVVIEGAGSPAEINLRDCDIVNMRVALHCQAACLLITDIDRGGAFAHLYGTWALLPETERALIQGFVLNKFRGDAALLAPGPQMLQDADRRADRGHVADVVAARPARGGRCVCQGSHARHWRVLAAPRGDAFRLGAARRRNHRTAARDHHRRRSPTPRISNLDEFQPLNNVPGVHLKWARCPADLAGADWIILPGSKHTSSDLAWLRAQGLDRAIAAHAGQGGSGAGRLRRPADAGRGADRPARHRRQCARPGPAAAGHAVRARQDRAAHPGRLRAADRRLGGAGRRVVSKATKSTTARPPSTRRWRRPATWPAWR